MKQIGTVTHYYDKLGVAIVELKAGLKVGDMIKIEKGDEGFEQEVAEMQIDRKSVTKAKRGDVVGIKVSARPKEKAAVSLV